MANLFKKLTHAAASVDMATISQCSSAESNKYSILGTLVYIPLVTGVAAMAFASSYFTHCILLIAALCIVWACVVFVIERALIAGLRPRTWSWAVPVRIILAFAMSCIITELLMIFFFKADIYSKIAEKKAAETELIYSTGNARVEELKEELAERKRILDEKEKSYLDEIDGRNGTGIHGYGPSAKAKELALNQERAYYEDAKRRLDEEIAAASSHRDETLSELEEGRSPGLLQCIIALYELAAEERNVARALWIVHIFFLCVELMPLFIKLSYEGTQYYDIMDMTDNQKLEAKRLTIDDTKEMMRLESQCEIAQQEIAIKDKMTRLLYQQAGNQAIMAARSLYETAQMLDDLQSRNKVKISDSRAEQIGKEVNVIFDNYIEEQRNGPTAA